MKESNTVIEYYKELSETLQEKNMELLEKIKNLEEKTTTSEEKCDIQLSKDELRFRDEPVLLTMNTPNGTEYHFYKTLRGYDINPNQNNDINHQKEKYAYFNSKTMLVKRSGTKQTPYTSYWSDKEQGYYTLAKELKNTYNIKDYLIVPGYYETKILSEPMLVSLNEFKVDFPEITVGKIVNLFKDEIRIGYIEMINWEERKFLENLYKDYDTFDSDLKNITEYTHILGSSKSDVMTLSFANLSTKMTGIIRERKDN